MTSLVLRLIVPAMFIGTLPTNALAQAVPRWIAEPEWRLDSDTRRLDAAVAGVVSDSGELLAVLLLDRTIIRVDQRGQLIGALGRQGGGPGEFQRPVAVGLLGDTLWIADNVLRRFTLFAPNKDPLTRNFGDAFEQPQASGNGFRVRPLALLTQGRVLLENPINVPDTSARTTVEAGHVLLANLRSGRLDSLSTFVRRSPVIVARVAGSGFIQSLNPFALNDLVTFDPRGRSIVFVRMPTDQRDASISVTAWKSDGTRSFQRQIAFEPRYLTKGEIDQVIDRMLGLQRPSTQNAPAVQIISGPTAGSILPPVKSVHVGADQSIWLGRSVGDWLVLDALGKSIGTISLPKSTRRLLAVSAKRIWALDENETTGVVTVVCYRIRSDAT